MSGWRYGFLGWLYTDDSGRAGNWDGDQAEWIEMAIYEFDCKKCTNKYWKQKQSNRTNKNRQWKFRKINTRNINKNNVSGTKGVCYSKAVNKYVAFITFKGKKLTKRFNTLEEAIKCRKNWENIYYKPILNKYNKLD